MQQGRKECGWGGRSSPSRSSNRSEADRNIVTYGLKRDRRVVYHGMTNDPARSENEHRAGGKQFDRLVVTSRRMTEEGARKRESQNLQTYRRGMVARLLCTTMPKRERAPSRRKAIRSLGSNVPTNDRRGRPETRVPKSPDLQKGHGGKTPLYNNQNDGRRSRIRHPPAFPWHHTHEFALLE